MRPILPFGMVTVIGHPPQIDFIIIKKEFNIKSKSKQRHTKMGGLQDNMTQGSILLPGAISLYVLLIYEGFIFSKFFLQSSHSTFVLYFLTFKPNEKEQESLSQKN